MKQENLAHTYTQFKPEASVKTLMQTFFFLANLSLRHFSCTGTFK